MQPDLGIVVVSSVAERVNICDIYIIGKLGVRNSADANTPRIVGISRNSFSVLVGNLNDVALQILNEIVGDGLSPEKKTLKKEASCCRIYVAYWKYPGADIMHGGNGKAGFRRINGWSS